ncbi:MAG: O-antigen ligase family protein [Pyrinomonadaceae bacterium]
MARWLERATVVCLFLLAFAAPVSIAATQTAWLLALLLWVARFAPRPRPRLARTPVDYALLGFFVLTFVSSLTSYEPDVSIGKLRAASLFTIVYVLAENVWSSKVLRALVVTLVASCVLSALYTFGVFAVGRGVKVLEMTPESTLRAAGVREGDTLLSVDGAKVGSLDDVARLVANERPALDKTYRWTDNRIACAWDARAACVRVYREENLPAFNVARDALAPGAAAAGRLGVTRWSRGRDERASGFYGQYQTYSEVLQLVASLALGLLVARGRRLDARALLCAAALACLCGAMLLTVTRASWAGLLASSLTIVLVGARRRTVLIFSAIALPLVVAGALVLREKRGVGFLDQRDLSTTWRETVWREGARILVSKPRHLVVGVGMDTLKRRWREWGMFDQGRLPWGHLHSTPLQIAFERGLPALAAWLALLFLYARTAWRLARRATDRADWIERGLGLGALGGAVGFFAGGLVHYNLGDSEVAMVFYIIMGLTLAADRLTAR